MWDPFVIHKKIGPTSSSLSLLFPPSSLSSSTVCRGQELEQPVDFRPQHTYAASGLLDLAVTLLRLTLDPTTMFYSSAIHVHTSSSPHSRCSLRCWVGGSSQPRTPALPPLLQPCSSHTAKGGKGETKGEIMEREGGGRRGRREMMACGPIGLMDSSVRYGSCLRRRRF